MKKASIVIFCAAWIGAYGQTVDYSGAIGNFAPTCNYATGRTTSIDTWVNHWIGVGNYANAISWFLNCNSSVSAHFVIRASDGQITQVVKVANTAWHCGANGYPLNNPRSIGVEHDANISNPGNWNSIPMLTASTDMACYFTELHDIPKTRSLPGIREHKEMPGTNTDCAGTIPWTTWMSMLNSSSNCSGGGCTAPASPTTTFGTSACPGTDGDELDWNSVSGATGYLVYVSKYPYGSSNLVNNFDPYDCDDLGLATSLDVSSLEPGMLYRWNMNATGDCNDANCESAISSTKYFHLPPNIDNVGSTEICQGEDVSLELDPNPTPGSGASKTYQWYRNGNQISGATSASYNATQAGDYTIKITYTGSSSCASATTDESNEIDVTILDEPAEPEIDGSLSFCAGSNTTLTISNQNQCDDCTYDWSDGTNDEISITVSSAGTYSVTATNSCGSESASVNVTETNNQPAPSIIGDTEICPGESTTLSIGNSCGGCSYEWNDGATQQSINVNIAGTYSVTVTGNCGTASSSQTVVAITNPCSTGIEDAENITDLKIFPNPSNGLFMIRFSTTTEQEINVSIMNIVGQLIYQTTPQKVVGEFSLPIELKEAATGVYFVRLKSGNDFVSRKIIINR